jgi:transcriptional regulator GlxA family with amidase domain
MAEFDVILFNDFALLDAFGPAQVIGYLDKIYRIGYFSENGGIIRSSQNAGIETLPLSGIAERSVILIPGGFGTRREANNVDFIRAIGRIAESSEFVLTVCTGSALLAKTGLLKRRKATSNKLAFDWAREQDKDVDWIEKARWVADGKYYTSSGVSAGIDMTLGFVSDRLGREIADKIAYGMEYIRNPDPGNDPFSR